MVLEVQRMRDIVNAKQSVEEQGEQVKDTLIKQLTVKLQEQTKKARDPKGRIKVMEESRGEWEREQEEKREGMQSEVKIAYERQLDLLNE